MAQALIGALRVNLGLNSAAFQKGLKQSGGKLKAFGRAASKGLLGIGIAGATAVTGIGLAVRGVLNEADKMSKVSKQIGIPIDELSRLKHAAELSGVSFENLQTGVGRLSKNINDAFNGLSGPSRAFDQLGISVKNADGSMKSSTAVMAEISDKFAAMPDGAEKTALAMDLMGKSGAKMIPMLNGGASALNSLLKEADDLGIVFDQKTATAAENFNDNMSRLGTVFKAVGMQIAADLAPHLADFTAWLVKNAPAIREFISASIDNISTFISSLVSGFGSAQEAFNNVSSTISNFVTQVEETSSRIFNAFVNLPSQMAQIGSDIMSGLWAGIEAKWTEVKENITGVASGIKDRFTSFFRIQSPSRVMMEIGQFIMEGLGQGISNGAAGVGEVAKNALDPIAGTLQNSFSSWFDKAIDGTFKFKDALIDLGKTLLKQFSNRAFSHLLGMFFGGGFGGGFSLPSFAGGGTTFSGPRVGGVDGKGGFPAILHPNETVIDHTMRRNSSGGASSLHVTLSPDLEARMMKNAGNQSVKISRQTVQSAAPSIAGSAVSSAQESFRTNPSRWSSGA